MDIWIIQNGEKVGPIRDFELRGKIEAGELPASTPAWHEGMESWRPLVEISLFTHEFDRRVEARDTPYAPPLPEPEADTNTSPKGTAHPLRRFWARWLDLNFYAGIWWIAMWVAGRDIGAIMFNPWIMLLLYAPWFVLETLLIHYFRSTPGKWLLGIQVLNDNGSSLSLAESTRRSLLVLVMGIGFGFGWFVIVCQVMAYISVRRKGRPLWDLRGGHQVTARPLNPLAVTAYVVILFTAFQLQFVVVAPYVIETTVKVFPSLKNEFEKNPPWHLPERH